MIIQKVAQIVDLTADLDKQVKNFSGGIDPKLSRQIWQELRQRRNLGCGILVTTTYVMSEAELTDAVYPNRGSAADFLLWTGTIKQSAALDRLFFKNSAIDLCQRCLK